MARKPFYVPAFTAVFMNDASIVYIYVYSLEILNT